MQIGKLRKSGNPSRIRHWIAEQRKQADGIPLLLPAVEPLFNPHSCFRRQFSGAVRRHKDHLRFNGVIDCCRSQLPNPQASNFHGHNSKSKPFSVCTRYSHFSLAIFAMERSSYAITACRVGIHPRSLWSLFCNRSLTRDKLSVGKLSDCPPVALHCQLGKFPMAGAHTPLDCCEFQRRIRMCGCCRTGSDSDSGRGSHHTAWRKVAASSLTQKDEPPPTRGDRSQCDFKGCFTSLDYNASRLREWAAAIVPLHSACKGCYGSARMISPLPFLLYNARFAIRGS